MSSQCFTSTTMSQKRSYQNEILWHFLSGWCAGVKHGELTFSFRVMCWCQTWRTDILWHFLSGWCAGVTHGELTFSFRVMCWCQTWRTDILSASCNDCSLSSAAVTFLTFIRSPVRTRGTNFSLTQTHTASTILLSECSQPTTWDGNFICHVFSHRPILCYNCVNFLPFFTIPWFCSPAAALLTFLRFFTYSKSDILICTQWNCKSLLILINSTDAYKFALTTSLVRERTLCLPTESLQWALVHTSTLWPNVAY